MIAQLLADDQAATLATLTGVLVAVAALGGKLWRTATKVARWVDRQEERYAAVDVVVQDWSDRGLTPAGAVREAADHRATTVAHTAAIASHEGRLDDHEERIQRSEQVNAHISQRLDEIAEKIGRT